MTEAAQSKTAILSPLPKLPARRTTFCSQVAVDACTAYLERTRQDLLYNLYREEGVQHTHLYYETAWTILQELEKANFVVPEEAVGKLDLAIEISRRLRAANGMPEFPVQGRPLAADPENLPPLINLPLDDYTLKRGALTQEQADRILAKTYKERPALWFAMAEEYRNDLLMSATAEFMALMEQVVIAEFPEDKQLWAPGDLRTEAVRRIYKMCGIEETG
jgi:hypothetical protein